MKLDRVKVGELTLWPLVEADGVCIYEAALQTVKELEHLKSQSPNVFDAHHLDKCLVNLRKSIERLTNYYEGYHEKGGTT